MILFRALSQQGLAELTLEIGILVLIESSCEKSISATVIPDASRSVMVIRIVKTNVAPIASIQVHDTSMRTHSHQTKK